MRVNCNGPGTPPGLATIIMTTSLAQVTGQCSIRTWSDLVRSSTAKREHKKKARKKKSREIEALV